MAGKTRGSTVQKTGRATRKSHRASGTPQPSLDSTAGADDPDDDPERTPTRSLGRKQNVSEDLPKTPTGMTKRSTAMMADLDLDESATAVREDMDNAIHDKMVELTVKGWRPDEEMGVSEDGDDDDYAALDLISESDDDDRAVRKFEARAFQQPEMSVAEQNVLARRLSLSSSASDDQEWNGFEDVDTAAGGLPQMSRYLDYDESRLPSFLTDNEEGQSFPRSPRISAEKSRKVRFQDQAQAHGSDDESSGSDNGSFPDLFLDMLPLGSHRPILIDDYYGDDNSDAASTVYDFEGDEMDVDDDSDDLDDSSSDSEGASSGYDSDEGETTDEDEPVPMRPEPVEASATPSKDANTPATVSSNKKRRSSQSKATKAVEAGFASDREPPSGMFDLDPARPVLLVEGSGVAQRNTIYPPGQQTPDEKKRWQRLYETYANRTAYPRTSVQMAQMDPESEMSIGWLELPTDVDGKVLMDPTGMNGFTDLVGFSADPRLGLPEALLDDQSMQSDAEVMDEMDIISPFINFDALNDDDDEGEEEEDDDEDQDDDGGSDATHPSLRRKRSRTRASLSCPTTPRVGSTTPTPSLRRASTLTSDGDDLFSHLTKTPHLVNSFRMNQHYAKEFAAQPSHPSARASTSESNAMQSGRRKAGNTPITPLRKKRGGSISRKADWSRKDGSGQKRPGSAGRGVMGRPHVRPGLFR